MDEKTQTTPVNSKPAWVQLYEARRVRWKSNPGTPAVHLPLYPAARLD